jgi:hypothetical protein
MLENPVDLAGVGEAHLLRLEVQVLQVHQDKVMMAVRVQVQAPMQVAAVVVPAL